MLHGSDRHLLECGLKTDVIAADVEAEYEVRRKMYHRMGGSGALGMVLIVDMLRSLGYGEFKDAPVVVVQWQDHLGAPVDVLYGSETLRCVLTGLSDMGRLFVKHPERGVLEMPRHAVKLAPSSPETPAIDWAMLGEGTSVVVDGTKHGTYIRRGEEGDDLLIQMANKQCYTYSADRVKLSE